MQRLYEFHLIHYSDGEEKVQVVNQPLQELRVIAEGSQDPLWLDVFNSGKDLHGIIASKVFSIDIDKVRETPEFVTVGTTKVFLRGKSPRDVTKTLNFALAYGASEYKIADTLGIKVEEAKSIIDEYFKAIPKVKAFLEACAHYGVRNGFIRSYKPVSGMRRFSDYDVTDLKQKGQVERMSKNTPIQMTGAFMCKIAMRDVLERIEKTPYRVEMCLQVHDAIYCYVDEEYAEEWAKIQVGIMEEAGRIFLKSIPCIVDAKVSDYWKK